MFETRNEPCPRCRITGTLETIHQTIEETPGCWPLLRRARRCQDCGARVEDVRELAASPASLSRRLLSLFVQ